MPLDDLHKMQLFLFRVIDILTSLIGIICGLPIMLTIYLVGLFDTGSPLFFQQRVGKNKKLFTLVKFRTMSINTNSVGTHLVDATSITKIGSFLRKTKLDELPQLFNVLFGQMSLVGPRPCLSNQTELVKERDQRGVFKVRPGVTGLAQVNDVDMSTPRKLARYDALMINCMGLKLYVKLIINTLLGQGHGDRVRRT
jgi:O-antigen biosynthesis protein WbqP